MDCAKSIALLSDLCDGILPEVEQMWVREHLALCSPCNCIYVELETIVLTAKGLSDGTGLTFPDETLIWQKMSVSRRSVQ